MFSKIEATSGGGSHNHAQVECLDLLTTQTAVDFAGQFSSFLDSFGYDEFNYLIRGDHRTSPFPLVGIDLVRKANEMLSDCNNNPEGRDVPPLMRLLLLGDTIESACPKRVLGDDLYHMGKSLGIFHETADGSQVSLNGLVLVSKPVSNQRSSYFLADRPGSRYVSAAERVYIGPDSYQLMQMLREYRNLNGVVAEAGSGSGIQLISILLKNPGVTLALGLESSQRARNVSIFNAHLNGVSDRYRVYDHPAELVENVPPAKLVLALTNPPFIPCPSIVKGSSCDGPVDIREHFPAATFGGRDGLLTTRRFVNILLPLLAPQGELVVFSQFAMRQDRPLLQQELESDPNMADLKVRFFHYDRKAGAIPIDLWAEGVQRLWEFENLDTEIKHLGGAVAQASLIGLQDLQVAAIEPGFLVLSYNSSWQNFESILFAGESKSAPYEAFTVRNPPIMLL